VWVPLNWGLLLLSVSVGDIEMGVMTAVSKSVGAVEMGVMTAVSNVCK
jgi:hypothetical protein